MTEADLYPLVEEHFTNLGYEVKGEVLECDLVAVRDNSIIIVELKKTFNVKLLYQAVRRLNITPDVYVAVFKPSTKQKRSHWQMMRSLSRRLHLGLIVADSKGINILVEPYQFKHTIIKKKRDALLTEFNGRKVGVNIGGVTGQKIQTAYLENAIHISVLLKKKKALSASELQKLGTGDKTYSILYNNHYGWFEKKEKGIYSLKKGKVREIKKEYKEIWHYYENA